MNTTCLPDAKGPDLTAGAVPSESAGIRESMRALPAWLQPWLTWITGKALPGAVPKQRRRTILLILGITQFGGSIAASIALLRGPAWGWPLLVITMLLTVSAARWFQTSFVHYASHRTLLRPEWLNDLIGELLSVLSWTAPLRRYREEHLPHHSATATQRDADLRFLRQMLGLEPGLPESELRRRVLRAQLSPRFHLRYARARLRANFLQARPLRALAAWTYTAVVLAMMWGWWMELTLAIVVPLFPLFHIAAVQQLLGEHVWVRAGETANPRRVVLARLTHARFFGERAPDPMLSGGVKWAAWLGWWSRMFLIHLPARILVAPGDLPNHDWHHRHPGSSRWADAAEERERDRLGGSSDWPVYLEVWGVRAAQKPTFQLLARLPREADLGNPLTYGELTEMVLAM